MSQSRSEMRLQVSGSDENCCRGRARLPQQLLPPPKQRPTPSLERLIVAPLFPRRLEVGFMRHRRRGHGRFGGAPFVVRGAPSGCGESLGNMRREAEGVCDQWLLRGGGEALAGMDDINIGTARSLNFLSGMCRGAGAILTAPCANFGPAIDDSVIDIL